MSIFKLIREALYPRDVFDCDHCRKRSKGRHCENCTDKPPRGCYRDEDGGVCKPTVRIPPTKRGDA